MCSGDLLKHWGIVVNRKKINQVCLLFLFHILILFKFRADSFEVMRFVDRFAFDAQNCMRSIGFEMRGCE